MQESKIIKKKITEEWLNAFPQLTEFAQNKRNNFVQHTLYEVIRSIITGTPPIPGFPKGVKIIQYGGHTLEKGTLKALNITKEEGKFAIESMKKANNLSPNFHGNIGSDGSFWSKTWEYIDNILDYLY